MVKKIRNEARLLASSRSRLGQAEEDRIKKIFDGDTGKIKIQTDKDANVFSDFAKYLEQEIRKELEPEIQKLRELHFSLTKKKIN